MSSRVEQFQALVTGNPGNELFRFSLAQALLAEQRTADAVPHLEFCVRQRVDWMIPRIVLGKTLIALNRRDEAKPLLEDALRLAIEQAHEEPERDDRALLADL
ncbi:MAG: molecular chaperone DnaJ [Opitutaceae bacterium]|nr:molecular chaperone DnaJ [Opitutaceae bacterium]